MSKIRIRISGLRGEALIDDALKTKTQPALEESKFWKLVARVEKVLAQHKFKSQRWSPVLPSSGVLPTIVPRLGTIATVSSAHDYIANVIVSHYFNQQHGVLRKDLGADTYQFSTPPRERRKTKKEAIKQISELVVLLKKVSSHILYEMSRDAIDAFGQKKPLNLERQLAWRQQLDDWIDEAERARAVLEDKEDWPIEEVREGAADDPVAFAMAEFADKLFRAEFKEAGKKQVRGFVADLFKGLGIKRSAKTYLDKLYQKSTKSPQTPPT
jgi:hypothetical protein